MLYRQMGKTGVEVSALGFGAMRLPTIDGDNSKINEEIAIKMIRDSIDNGVNYLDTAHGYHGGMSEVLCGKVLKDGYREKVHIATKLPSYIVKEEADMEKFLNEQLERLDIECIDFYLLHTLRDTYFEMFKKMDYKGFLKRAKAEGKIKHIGFSFHDNIDVFKEIVDDFDWDFCQIQLNYMDENYQAGIEGMKYAAAKGMGVIIMEPLRGGMLAKKDQPKKVEDIWAESETKRSPAEWALKWTLNHPEVSTVLSGMSLPEQVEENLRVAATTPPSSLSKEESDLINRVRDYYLDNIRVNCTNCRYCMPCPYGINIPELFWGYNHDGMFDDFGKGKFWTTGYVREPNRAHHCVSCGVCVDLCPQHIDIPTHMEKIVELYGKGE